MRGGIRSTLSREEAFLEARDHESSAVVSDQSSNYDAVASPLRLLGGKWERGSDFQRRADGKAQRACRREKGIEVLTG